MLLFSHLCKNNAGALWPCCVCGLVHALCRSSLPFYFPRLSANHDTGSLQVELCFNRRKHSSLWEPISDAFFHTDFRSLLRTGFPDPIRHGLGTSIRYHDGLTSQEELIFCSSTAISCSFPLPKHQKSGVLHGSRFHDHHLTNCCAYLRLRGKFQGCDLSPLRIVGAGRN